MRYRAPLRFDDEFDIKVRVGEVRHSSWAFEYAVDRADGLHCAEMTTVQVMIDRATFGATRIPPELRATLERAKGTAARSPAGWTQSYRGPRLLQRRSRIRRRRARRVRSDEAIRDPAFVS